MTTKNIKLTLLTASILFLAACAKDTSSKAPDEQNHLAGNIIGGAKSTDSFQKKNGLVALIIRSKAGDGICTGTLISKKIILTAAHCLDSSESPIEMIAVVFTQNVDKASKESLRFGVKIHAHELFAKTAGGPSAWNDIALIKLNDEAPAGFKFARLPSVVMKPIAPQTPLLLAGYGMTEAGLNSVKDTSGVLMQVSDVEVAGLVYDNKEIVLQQNKRGACNGDSGGPAFIKLSSTDLIQVGITSRGTPGCADLSIYTSVAAHLDWISKTSNLLMATE